MKIIINNIIPFKGYKAINLFGVIFARKELNIIDKNHEAIHTAQMKELWYIGFYILYFIEWLGLLPIYGKHAYNNISFEIEAYGNERNISYLKNRPKYAMW